MKVLWLGFAGGGNVPPQVAFCEALVQAGHDVRAVIDGPVCAELERHGIPAEPTTAPERPSGLFGSDLEEWVYINRFMGPTYNDDLLAAIQRHQPDRLLIDGFLYDAHVAAFATGIPYAAVGHVLLACAWGGHSAARLDEITLASHNEHRRRVGLEAVGTARDTLFDADWYLAMTYQDLDAPDAPAWPKRHYVGAHVPSWSPVDLALPEGDDPLVVVAFSTTPMGQQRVLQEIAAALAELDVRVLITTGPSLRVEDLDLPANATAVRYAPHDQVLPGAALMISHVGHGSMAAAARNGVPILALPMGRDQYRNAEVLADHGIGVRLPPSASATEIAAAVESLLDDDAVRRAARDMAGRIAEHDGLDHAISLLSGAPPPRSVQDAPSS
jgi:UDP:flavonoid glycosyltransferase YjiC (YdhE family)